MAAAARPLTVLHVPEPGKEPLMTALNRNGQPYDEATGRFVTASRTTRTTRTEEVEVTERVTFGDADTLVPLPLTEPVPWAQGWDPGPIQPHGLHLAQRRTQAGEALGLLVKVVQSLPPEELTPEVRARWVRQAVTVLRAGPNATPLELTMGRSI